jgi:hypothetical protein
MDYSYTCDCGHQEFGFNLHKEAKRRAVSHLRFRDSWKCENVYIDQSKDHELTGAEWRVTRLGGSAAITIVKL